MQLDCYKWSRFYEADCCFSSIAARVCRLEVISILHSRNIPETSIVSEQFAAQSLNRRRPNRHGAIACGWKVDPSIV